MRHESALSPGISALPAFSAKTLSLDLAGGTVCCQPQDLALSFASCLSFGKGLTALCPVHRTHSTNGSNHDDLLPLLFSDLGML